ncbi:ComF family protein [Candidatus Nitronereus thalassa]|uniref:ComF family protein n=1 Tax=Candidatus Nitronereus thalassa TaxID=3020898 RepID=A0ABU3KAP8_9BACT|nr:ComF family protein [Candidatus Nitronereus thalassa]MDT7043462.1 ComF family protein [Candidatus Nitronereus thalassa]
MTVTSARLLHRVLHTLFPTPCLSCGEALLDNAIPYFCEPCWGTISVLPEPKCPRCHLPFSSASTLTHSPQHLCGRCRQRPPAFTKACTPYAYQGVLKDAISQFKYHGKVRLAKPLAQLMASAWDLPQSIDGIIAVPLHPTRLREREYNQSLLLAERLSHCLGLPVMWNILVRTHPTVPQTTLKRAARLKNLRKSFAVTRPEVVSGKQVLLVDDVYTTGTTINECAKTLRKAGAADVFVETLARMV